MKILDQEQLCVRVREASSEYHLQVIQNISPHLTLSLSRYLGESEHEMVIVHRPSHVFKPEHIKLFKNPLKFRRVRSNSALCSKKTRNLFASLSVTQSQKLRIMTVLVTTFSILQCLVVISDYQHNCSLIQCRNLALTCKNPALHF